MSFIIFLLNKGASITKVSISPPSPAGLILWLSSSFIKSSTHAESMERPNHEASNGSAATPVIIEVIL